MKAALAALALLGAFVPSTAIAQDGLRSASTALHDAAVGGCADLPAGRLAVRVASELPDAAPDANGLLSALVEPTTTALRADPRFGAVHLAGFGRDDAAPALVAHRLGYAGLLDVVVRVSGGELVIEGTTWSTADGVRRAAFSERVDLDVALRRFVGFPAIVADEAVRARSVRMPSRGYIALAVVDLDGDGRAEIIGVRPDGVHVVRVRGGAFDRGALERVGRADFPDDLPRAPIPRRRVFATAVADGDRAVVRTSEHALGLEIRLDGGVPVVTRSRGPCETDRFPVVGGCAALVAGRDFFTEGLTHASAPHEAAAANFYAYAFGQFETREGDPTSYEALVTPSGRLALRVRWERPPEGGSDEAPEIRERSAGAVGYGTALAMADLDFDGAAELLVSHAAPAGRGDQLSLLRALPRGALRVMWRGDAVGGSIWVAAAGDVDGDGLPELLAIEEPAAGRGRAALWIVR